MLYLAVISAFVYVWSVTRFLLGKGCASLQEVLAVNCVFLISTDVWVIFIYCISTRWADTEAHKCMKDVQERGHTLIPSQHMQAWKHMSRQDNETLSLSQTRRV